MIELKPKNDPHGQELTEMLHAALSMQIQVDRVLIRAIKVLVDGGIKPARIQKYAAERGFWYSHIVKKYLEEA